LKSAVVLVGIFMRLMNLVNYIFVHQDARYGIKCSVQLVARIKGVNETIWLKKCGGFGGCSLCF